MVCSTTRARPLGTLARLLKRYAKIAVLTLLLEVTRDTCIPKAIPIEWHTQQLGYKANLTKLT